jgi:peptide/nickel transport system substrate-binding protein
MLRKGGAINYAWLRHVRQHQSRLSSRAAGRAAAIDLVFGNNRLRYAHDSARPTSPFSLYPLLAKSIETDDERTFVEFTLDERAANSPMASR